MFFTCNKMNQVALMWQKYGGKNLHVDLNKYIHFYF